LTRAWRRGYALALCIKRSFRDLWSNWPRATSDKNLFSTYCVHECTENHGWY